MAKDHRLAPSLENVHWGFFDAKLPPGLTVDSGDAGVVDTVSGWPEVAPDPALYRPDHYEIATKLKPVLGARFLTFFRKERHGKRPSPSPLAGERPLGLLRRQAPASPHGRFRRHGRGRHGVRLAGGGARPGALPPGPLRDRDQAEAGPGGAHPDRADRGAGRRARGYP